MIDNYSKLINAILETAFEDEQINFAGEGDIYEINNDPNVKYPVFWTAATQPARELENYFVYTITLYYVDRLIIDSNEQKSTNSINITSNGISCLSNIINKLRCNENIYSIDNEISYTIFNDTQVFADHCNGVFCNVVITIPKINNCVDLPKPKNNKIKIC